MADLAKAGPGDTADAETAEEAAFLADHWGDVIATAAFDFGLGELGG